METGVSIRNIQTGMKEDKMAEILDPKKELVRFKELLMSLDELFHLV